MHDMKQSKITFLTSVGAGLEYYDIVIYSLLADFISRQFFPSENQVASLFATFGVFAFGNIIRPLGGMILGVLGDRFGRKNIFANTLLWMSIATFLMGIIPSFSSIGLTATVLFSICRILQGIVFGAELPGAMTLILEHVSEKKHGLHFGFMISAVGLGVSLGSFVTWGLTQVLTEQQMLDWGFRIPFLLGGVLAIVGFYVRRHVPETKAFLSARKENKKLDLKIMKKHVWQVCNVIGILLFPASFVTYFLVLPVYLHDVYGYKFSDIYLAITCSYLWSSFLIPIFGWVSDYIGRKFLLILSALTMVFFGIKAFSLLHKGEVVGIWGFVLFSQTVIAGMAASYFVMVPQAFQTAIRFTGTAFSYNIAYTISAFAPLIANYFYGVMERPNYVVWGLIFLACVTIINAVLFKSRYKEIL